MAKDETLQKVERETQWAVHWEEARVHGRWRFIWLSGAVEFGVPMAIMSLAWRWWKTGAFPAAWIVLFTAVVMIGAGLAYGALTWRRAERRYQRWLATQSHAVSRVFD